MNDLNGNAAKFPGITEQQLNAYNHPNFNPPDIRRDASTFGQILSAKNGRIIQLGLKLNF